MKILIANLLFCSNYALAWEFSETVDIMTDETKRSAFVENENGHRFSVYRIEPGGQVFANFSLSEDSFDQIDSEKLGVYRIDKSEPETLVDARKLDEMFRATLGETTFEWTPKWVNFLIWHGDEEQGLGRIDALISGQQLAFRYYLPTGGYKDTIFDIQGGAEVIGRALQLSDKSQAERAQIEQSHQMRVDEVNKGSAKCKAQHANNPVAFSKCMVEVTDRVGEEQMEAE